ncbi:MAG TPA: arsenate reductase ArsC [Gaiellaceae bacterium]|jgi:protein-tyrosine-phosphatase|nr:arsenate reductase ArsC [Gaiellaceae bacterium]
MNVYFVCVGNSGRSQMAQAFAERAGHEARSAGSRPWHEIEPNVKEAMAEVGIDLSGRSPKPIDEADVEWADVVVTMGCGEDACPVLPGKKYLDWNLDDPFGLPVEDIRPIRDEIERRVNDLSDSGG